MKVPMALRLGLAWAALRGNYVSISYDARGGLGGQYRFEMVDPPKRWLKRRDRIKAKRVKGGSA